MSDKEFLDEPVVDEVVPDEGTDQEATDWPTEGQPKRKVNLDEFPEFQQAKSSYDKQLAERDKKLFDERKARLQTEQRLQQVEQQMDAAATAGMNGEQRATYAYRKLEQQHRALQSQLHEQGVETARMATLQEISAETGAPIEKLMTAQNPDEAWRMGARYMKDRGNPEGSREERNDVDLGTGRTRSKGSDLQARYNLAMKKYDTNSALDIMGEAELKGITLKL